MSLVISFEQFIEKFDHQFEGAQILGYYVWLPLFTTLILMPSIAGIVYKLRFVYAGFAFMAAMLFWDFFIMGYLFGWIEGSEIEDCDFEYDGLDLSICFCELYQTFREDFDPNITTIQKTVDRLVLQPSSTISNLSFCASGIFCLFVASCPLDKLKPGSYMYRFIADIRDNGNPLSRRSSSVSLVYGLIVVFIGPASMIYHASITLWAGVIDVVSILIWVSFCVAYSFSQLFFHDTEIHRDEHTYTTMNLMAIVFLILVSIAIVVYLITERSTILYLCYFAMLIGLESIVQYYEIKGKPFNGVKRDRIWLILSIIIFLTALGIWIPSGGATTTICPSYWPHAVWHILAGFATFFMYLYYCSEVDLDEIKEGRVRARSFRTRKLQDELFGLDFAYGYRGPDNDKIIIKEQDSDDGKEGADQLQEKISDKTL